MIDVNFGWRTARHRGQNPLGATYAVAFNPATKVRSMVTRRSDIVAISSRYVLLNVAAQMTGYTVKAMQRKIERGDWIEGKVWIRAPDGRILVDMFGFQRWVEGG